MVTPLHYLGRQSLSIALSILLLLDAAALGPADGQDSSSTYSDCGLCRMDDIVVSCMEHELAPYDGSSLPKTGRVPTCQLLAASGSRCGAASAPPLVRE